MVGNAIKEDFPSVNLEKLTSLFWAGQYISVSLLGDPQKRKPDFERLHSVDEVWAMCFRSIKGNQWRLLGRFYTKNIFIGLGLYRRRELTGSKYTRHAEDAILEWRQLFGDRAPIIGTQKYDYLSGVVRDVDQE
jgi:hypothetical protein